MTTTLDELRSEALRFRDAREWARFHTPKDLALGLCIEAGELAEIFQWKDEAECAALLADPAKRERVALEIADLQILLLYAAEAAGVSIADAVRSKLAINEKRYPVEKSRGSAKKYDEL
jgi:NTP pyrophosphatase (non-canonical NTP hydrolase)